MSLRAHLFIGSFVVAGLAYSASAAITVDGNLSDWGITVGDNNAHSYSLFSSSIGLVNSVTEDQNDRWGHSEYLGPAYGGQDFDAELMAVAYKNHTLNIAIETGQRPDNGFDFFAPGDILIVTSGGTYGIEVGGGKGGVYTTSAITEGASGSTYQLYSNGETKTYSAADSRQTAGSVWKNVTWLLSPVNNLPTEFQINTHSTKEGMADYVYTLNTSTTQHAVIELGLDVSMFNGETIKTITWRPSCGNDELTVPVNIVPEPATMLLLAGGFVALRNWRKRA